MTEIQSADTRSVPQDGMRSRRIQRVLGEMAIFIIAVAIAGVVVTHIAASTGRGEMMFLDGDSMIVPLLARSILDGDAGDWAMSAVLFVPETFVYSLLSLLGGDIEDVQLRAGIANFILIYLAFRLCAGSLSSGLGAAYGALGAYLAVCFIAMTEGNGDRNSLEIASLLAMTTYYSATVVAMLVSVGIARLIIERTATRRSYVALILVGALSTFSNPLYVAWLVLPLSVVACTVGLLLSRRRAAILVVAATSGSAAIGYIFRSFLDPWIVAGQDNYFRPTQWRESIAYYWALYEDRLSDVSGYLASFLTVALIALGITLTAIMLKRHQPGLALVAMFAWLTPLATTVGFIALGTDAARYLQPWAFTPALALCVLGADASSRIRLVDTRVPRVMTAIAAVITLTIAVTGSLTATRSVDSSLSCAVDWVNSTDRHGAGQFWSVRAVKTHVDDPARLLQVDYQMNGYTWLVDRRDYSQPFVSYLVIDSQSYPFTMPAGHENQPSTEVDCGRFKIIDYGTNASIPVGPTWP